MKRDAENTDNFKKRIISPMKIIKKNRGRFTEKRSLKDDLYHLYVYLSLCTERTLFGKPEAASSDD